MTLNTFNRGRVPHCWCI